MIDGYEFEKGRIQAQNEEETKQSIMSFFAFCVTALGVIIVSTIFAMYIGII